MSIQPDGMIQNMTPLQAIECLRGRVQSPTNQISADMAAAIAGIVERLIAERKATKEIVSAAINICFVGQHKYVAPDYKVNSDAFLRLYSAVCAYIDNEEAAGK